MWGFCILQNYKVLKEDDVELCKIMYNIGMEYLFEARGNL